MTGGVRVLYVASLWHSGSTLLDLLLSSHGAVTSVGEAVWLADPGRERCTCGVRDLDACPFWRGVDAGVRRRVGVGLERLVLRDGFAPDFAPHNRALFESVREETGRSVVVDSSKQIGRLAGLLATPGLDVRPIHLVRSPHGVVYSKLRKERGLLRESLTYLSVTLQIRDLLADRAHARVRYEELAGHTERALRRLMPELGRDFEPDQLAWAGRERHNLGGNRMRFQKHSEIRPDLAWRTGLSLWQKAVVGAVAGPAHHLPPWIHRVARPLRRLAARVDAPDDARAAGPEAGRS